MPNVKGKVVRSSPKRTSLFSGFPCQVSRTILQLCCGVFMRLAWLSRIHFVSGPVALLGWLNLLSRRSLTVLLSAAASC